MFLKVIFGRGEGEVRRAVVPEIRPAQVFGIGMEGYVPGQLPIARAMRGDVFQHISAGIVAQGVAHVVRAHKPVLVQRNVHAEMRAVLLSAQPGLTQGLGVFARVFFHGHFARIAPNVLAIHLVADDRARRVAIFAIRPGVALH